MKQLIIDWIYLNPAKVSIIVILSVIMITVSVLSDPKELTPQELETKLKQEITNLDSKRDSKLNDLQKVIDDATKCREFITKDKGTTSPIKECTEYKDSVIPVAQAMKQTNTGTATGATNPVPKRTRLKPTELLGPVKLADDCYVTQNETTHVRAENGGMFATDLACKFGAAGGKGGKAEVYAPDLRGKDTMYTVEYVGFDNLLGSFVQLRAIDAKKYNDCNSIQCPSFVSDESFILGHTETKFKVGDIVSTGQRLGQMTLNGATTGWHVHFEYRRLSPGGTWASQRYFTGLKEKTLDNKRKGVTYNGWKWGDKVFATNFNLGNVHENDASPWVGASGVNLKDYPRKVVALTVDVRRSLGIKLKDTIVIADENGNHYDVEVHDEMNMRFRNTGPKDCIKGNNGNSPYCIKMDLDNKTTKLPTGVYTLVCKKSECNIGQP